MPQAPLQGHLLGAYWSAQLALISRSSRLHAARALLARRGFVSPICLVWLRRYSCTITAYKPHPLLQHPVSPLVVDPRARQKKKADQRRGSIVLGLRTTKKAKRKVSSFPSRSDFRSKSRISHSQLETAAVSVCSIQGSPRGGSDLRLFDRCLFPFFHLVWFDFSFLISSCIVQVGFPFFFPF